MRSLAQVGRSWTWLATVVVALTFALTDAQARSRLAGDQFAQFNPASPSQPKSSLQPVLDDREDRQDRQRGNEREPDEAAPSTGSASGGARLRAPADRSVGSSTFDSRADSYRPRAPPLRN